MRRRDGHNLLELMAVVLLLAVFGAFAIQRLNQTEPETRATSLQAAIDTGVLAVRDYGLQRGAFGDRTAGQTWLTGGVASGLLADQKVAGSFPPAGDAMAVVVAGDMRSVALSRCVDYFRSGARLCLTANVYPWGDGSGPSAVVKRTVSCSGCSSKLYTSSGDVTGARTLASFTVTNGNWPRLPLNDADQ